jgi:hypothetical protein
MAPRRSKQPQISKVWAESLIGLSMKVPEYWWQGCKGYKLHDGRIDSFDIQTQKWNLIVDDRNEPLLFLMAYDTVSLYADEDSSTIEEYQLPYQAVFEGDDEIEAEDGTRYTQTATAERTKVDIEEGEDDGGRTINHIEKTGADEVEAVNITDEELKLLWDSSGEIRFEKVFEWCLPRIGDDDNESLSQFQAARMKNYMTRQIAEGWVPKYYTWDKVITADHGARLYGTSLAKMPMGNRSIEQIFCKREFLMQYRQFKNL